MRVLVVAHGFPPLAQGGAEIYAHQHARELVRQFADEVHVLAREQAADQPEYAVRQEHRDGLQITWVNNTFRKTRTFEESYRNEPIQRVAAGLIDAFRPDVAHLHHLTCLSTDIVRELQSRGIPTFYTLHDYWLLCHRGQLLDIHNRPCAGPVLSGCHACLGLASVPAVPSGSVPTLRAIERRLPGSVAAAGRRLATTMLGQTSVETEVAEAARRLVHMKEVCDRVTHFLAPSHSIRDRFIEFGIESSRISVSPYGFDHDRWRRSPVVGRPSGASSDVPSAPSRLRLGFLGSLMISKAPHVLLEAHRLMPAGSTSVDLFGAHVSYHGDASYASTLAPLLAQPGVRMHGPQPHEALASVLPQLDALVVTSVWPETSPLVIREAFLSGIPVIASRVGGIPELIEHGNNGLLVEPGDVDDLRRALARLIDEPSLLSALKAGAAGTSVRTKEDDAAVTRRLYLRYAARDDNATRSDAGRSDVRPRLAAVVLNYRTPDDTALAVASLLASDRAPDQVIVVDNDGDETCRLRLRRFGSRVTYISTGGNLGFSGGMNVGIRAALDNGAERVVLVNSDVVVAPDCVSRLENAQQQAGDAIVGPLVLSRAMPDLVASAGIDYNCRTGRMRHRGVGLAAAGGGGVDGPRDSVSGCLMLVPRSAFERVGLLDERYFFSFEEIEFCHRARQAGVVTRLVADAVAYHEGGRTMATASPLRLYFAARNHLLLASSIDPDGGGGWRAPRLLNVIGLNLAHAVRSTNGSAPARLGATVLGILDFLRGRFGPGPIARGL